MAATVATAVFAGKNTRYPIQCYVSDTAGVAFKWDVGGGASATSPDFLTFDEPVYLIDLAVQTGFTAARRYRILANGAPTRMALDPTVQLNTSTVRAPLQIGFRAGTRIQIIEQ